MNNKTDKKLAISPPWITYYNEINELFKDDPDVMVKYNEDDYSIKLYVDDSDKAFALSILLPPEKTFGNIVVKTTVVPPNLAEEPDIQLFERAFKNNPVVDFIKAGLGPFGDISYVVFKNKVVQFFNDNLSDLNGITSTLYENIATDVFEQRDGVFFCTNTEA